MKLSTKIGVVLVLALSSSYIYMALRGPQGFTALQTKWQEVRQLQQANAELSRDVAVRAERIRKLEQSPSEQELEIRKRLKMLRKGETTFIHPDEPEEK